MTDKRLDQILSQALAPEISDVEIAVKKARRNFYMNKIVKIGVSVVACAALLIVGNAPFYDSYITDKPEGCDSRG